MSKTNTQVQEAFGQGKAAINGRRSLESRDQGQGITFLRSYQTTIAIRRAKSSIDPIVFYDAHNYSTTTSQHQGGRSYLDPSFSFDCVRELMGPRWYESATIDDWGPHDCRDPECEREQNDQNNLYRAGLIDWYDSIHSQCWAEEGSYLGQDNQHAVTLPDYGNGRWSYVPAVLLSFDTGQLQVLCGFERGKALSWGGRTDQLWAAVLPFHVMDIRRAFEALKPSYVVNAQRDNATIANGNPDLTDGQSTVKVKRQGDLYFVSCNNGDGPPKDAVKLDDAPLPPSEDSSNHRASKVRVSFDSFGNPRNLSSGWRIWARGKVDHPEHPRLNIGDSWYRVLRSAAVRATSSAYAHPRGNSSRVEAD